MAVILVVDDTHVDRQIAKLVLEAHGHTVHEAPTGEDALQCLRRQPLDLVLIDMYMPGMSGVQLVEYMRADAVLAPIPVVFYTAWHDEYETEQALRAYGYAVLAKPVALQEFAPRIAQILHEAARTQRA
jgi:CheY-like chemotaxis protein